MNKKVFFVSFAISITWIIFSDLFVHNIFSNHTALFVQSLKGLIYVLASSLLFSWYVQKEENLITKSLQQKFNKTVFFVAVIFSVSWIIITDYLVFQLAPAEKLHLIETIKGLFYVTTYSFILAWTAQRELNITRSLFPLLQNVQVAMYTKMIIHEVRNPMTLMSLQMQKLKTIDDLNERKKIIRSVENQIYHLNETIEFFKTLAETGNGNISPNIQFKMTDIDEIINDVFQVTKLNNRGVEFISSIPHQFKIMASPSLMTHLFMNLFSNAVDYMKDNKVKAQTIEVSFQESVYENHIIVTNTGPQLSDIEKEQLFSTFSSKKERGGMGIGLLISKQIMHYHHGKIEFDINQPSPCFKLIFPKENLT